VIDGANRKTLADFQPFGGDFTHGIYVAAGDLTGDGKADVVVTPDLRGTPRVLVFSGAGLAGGSANQVASFLGLADVEGRADESFLGGGRPALADVDGDGKLDLLVTAGLGGGPRVTVWPGTGFPGATGGRPTVNPVTNLFVFEPSQRDGAFVTGGDVDGDGKAELVFGGGPNGGPRVRVVNGAGLFATPGFNSGVDLDRNLNLVLNNFFAGDGNTRGGVRVTMRDVDGDNLADLVTGSGDGLPAQVRVYAGSALRAAAGRDGIEPGRLQDPLDPFGASLVNGVFVG
ncbi:MAG: FG-GAP repeat domain-containing protein, partial [Fimbriiglobus sp.]